MEASTLAAASTEVPFFATGKRSRDLARERGISEAELLAAHDGPEVVRLRPEMAAIVEALPGLGEVMSLTRNEAAVHEIVGAFGEITLSGQMGLVLNPPLDLRLMLRHWHHAFAVELPDDKGPRRSLQIFDAAGEAVIKIHLRPASDVDAFDALRARFAVLFPEPISVEAYPVEEPSGAADADAFRREFAAMRDVHEFFPMLRRHGVDRRGSLDLMGAAHVRRLGEGTATALLNAASAAALPIMCFVGSRGCIQIFTGKVKTVKAMGPWINVLDPGYDLHLREDLVAEAFEVRKPSKDGELTAIELYDRERNLIAQFYGERRRDHPEEAGWRQLTGSLADG
jgi:putative hemin transport protein